MIMITVFVTCHYTNMIVATEAQIPSLQVIQLSTSHHLLWVQCVCLLIFLMFIWTVLSEIHNFQQQSPLYYLLLVYRPRKDGNLSVIRVSRELIWTSDLHGRAWMNTIWYTVPEWLVPQITELARQTKKYCYWWLQIWSVLVYTKLNVLLFYHSQFIIFLCNLF